MATSDVLGTAGAPVAVREDAGEAVAEGVAEADGLENEGGASNGASAGPDEVPGQKQAVDGLAKSEDGGDTRGPEDPVVAGAKEEATAEVEETAVTTSEKSAGLEEAQVEKDEPAAWFGDDEMEDDGEMEIEIPVPVDEAVLKQGKSVFDLYEDDEDEQASVANLDGSAQSEGLAKVDLPISAPAATTDGVESDGTVVVNSSNSSSSSSSSSSGSSSSSSSSSSGSSSSSSSDEDGRPRKRPRVVLKVSSPVKPKPKRQPKPQRQAKPKAPAIPHFIPPEFRVFENVTLDDRNFPILKGSYTIRRNQRACFQGHWGFCEEDFTHNRVSPFEYVSRVQQKDKSDRRPISGKYSGFFKLRQFNGTMVRVREEQVELQFMKLPPAVGVAAEGGDESDEDGAQARYEVIGKGKNRFGRFLIRGYLNLANGRLTVRRRYSE